MPGGRNLPQFLLNSGIEAPLMHSMRAQSFPTLCDPMDCNPPGSSVHGISQAGILGCPSLLQRIVPTQGLNLSLQHWQEDSSLLSHLGSPPVPSPSAPLCLGLCRPLPTSSRPGRGVVPSDCRNSHFQLPQGFSLLSGPP